MANKYWWMDIKDKVKIIDPDPGVERVCPPHYFPHKLPFGPKVTDEPCHYHTASLRMFHHSFFCLVLRCSNYDFMMSEYLEAQKPGELEQIVETPQDL